MNPFPSNMNPSQIITLIVIIVTVIAVVIGLQIGRGNNN